MTFRQKQKAAGIVGAVGAVLLLTAVGGFVARSLNRQDIPGEPAQVSQESEERSHVTGSASAGPSMSVVTPVVATPKKVAAAVPVAVVATATEPVKAGGAVHYPMEVGRYWVYRYHERESDVVTQVERRIVRHQGRENASDLFFFADGTIAYVEDGKIYEMGSNGGVNIIPVETEPTDPVRYRSQGLQIEKWVAGSDTAVVIDGHRFERCLEVVTRFRPDESGGMTVSYSSFYAPGIGLVGRQQWPTDASGSLAVTLSEYGTRQPPSTADGQP